MRGRMILAAMATTAAVWSTPASPHPHVFVEVQTELRFDEAGRLVAVHARWTFDDFYSVFAVEGLDFDGDGKPDPEGLADIARQNMEALPEYNYFTDVIVDGQQVALTAPSDAVNTWDKARLTLAFTLPLAEPVDPRLGQVEVVTYDPTYYIAMDPAPQNPAALAGAPPDCTVAVEAAPENETLADAIAQADLGMARAFALKSAPRVRVRCT